MNSSFTEEEMLSALFSNNNSGSKRSNTSNEKNVQTYDFKKALRYSQDQIRTLTRIHENCARMLTSYFTTELRTFVQISVASVEQYSYDEFLSNVGKRSILGIFKSPPLQGNMVMEFSANLTFIVLDRLLGGQGTGPLRDDDLDLTEIEISVIQRVFIKALASFQEAWTSIVKMSPELKEIEINPQFLSITPPNETVILVSMQVKIGDVEGKINICLPHVVLEQVLPKLSARHWLANQKLSLDKHEVKTLEKKLHSTEIDVRAVLGQTTIEFNDILKLKIGDYIRLNEFFDDPITVLVDEKPKFQAQPGLSKGRMAVQVTRIMGEGEDNDDN